ncbi:putative Cytochrome bd2, subunit II [Rhodovastum atsumiense]|uniref:Cytochrome d ubiquinol oxidase subunit II n=1 Tax=Rhodovastum atsumiense TaxID=504468 RepID=A0A5M6ISA5_9PROT|nr:cytochrome d ubiquinol oxidase subunit II [Rhodovastum atsumiense]KAA5611071.1 cytochrome d ubiquinol oxidase subunit II [Rhodovastum atsumiense]CAH2599130.1 putative Cytochrome bd2, subunit II [Rhodovastum atsumiense]
MDLPMIWAALIAFAVLAYVVLDGFDLGVGILFALERRDEDRDIMVNTVAPVWDGNETWLVLGGGGLLAVFPLAYAVILPALYPAIVAMLLALVFRGVAFEFRFRAATRRGREAWDFAFFAGSTLAAFCQGMALGGLLQGIRVENRAYAGGWFDWLTGFTLLCGIALVIGYALLGASWLIWRTDGALQRRCRRYAGTLGATTLALIGVVSLWTPMLNPAFMQRWFGWPGILLTSPVPLLVLLLAWGFRRGLARRHEVTPFLCALGWFVLCYAGLGISLFPLIVPPSITIWDAAAPPESQAFLLVGAAVLVPMILCYTGYAYWVFRGKVTPGTHYH